jgi:hypothetical protein
VGDKTAERWGGTVASRAAVSTLREVAALVSVLARVNLVRRGSCSASRGVVGREPKRFACYIHGTIARKIEQEK